MFKIFDDLKYHFDDYFMFKTFPIVFKKIVYSLVYKRLSKFAKFRLKLIVKLEY